jgi:selenocysteine lyase/cysteine desulfurase
LQSFKPYKVRPASEQIPDRWETGTQLHELIVGVAAAVDYLAEVGSRSQPAAATRRDSLLAAYRATVPYERTLLTKLIAGLLDIPKLRFFGITDPARFAERCSTVSVRIGDNHPTAIAAFLGDRGVFTWDGSFYALNLTERLGVEQSGGLLRIGLVHYNTMDEVERLLATLKEFAGK